MLRQRPLAPSGVGGQRQARRNHQQRQQGGIEINPARPGHGAVALAELQAGNVLHREGRKRQQRRRRHEQHVQQGMHLLGIQKSAFPADAVFNHQPAREQRQANAKGPASRRQVQHLAPALGLQRGANAIPLPQKQRRDAGAQLAGALLPAAQTAGPAHEGAGYRLAGRLRLRLRLRLSRREPSGQVRPARQPWQLVQTGQKVADDEDGVNRQVPGHDGQQRQRQQIDPVRVGNAVGGGAKDHRRHKAESGQPARPGSALLQGGQRGVAVFDRAQHLLGALAQQGLRAGVVGSQG